jgi:hypothetical protein
VYNITTDKINGRLTLFAQNRRDGITFLAGMEKTALFSVFYGLRDRLSQGE